MQGHDHVYARGFVTAQGTNAGLNVTRNAFLAGSGAPLYLTGGESGAVKWYNARKYSVQRSDPLTPSYGFLEINSAVAAQNPWGTDTSKTHEQTYTLVSVDGDEMRFQTYMLRYDGKADRMTTAPYLYDSLILHRGAALRADEAALEKLPPSSWNAELAAGSRMAEPALGWTVQTGLFQGRSGNLLAPNDGMNRAGGAVCFQRLQFLSV